MKFLGAAYDGEPAGFSCTNFNIYIYIYKKKIYIHIYIYIYTYMYRAKKTLQPY